MVYFNYFLILLFVLNTLYNVKGMNAEDEYRDQTEFGWPLDTRLIATSRDSVNNTKTLFLYAKGRTIDIDLKIPAPIDIQEKHNTLDAYFYAKQCLNPSDLDGLIIRLSSKNASIKASYTAIYNKEYNRFDVQHICSDTQGILTKPTVNLENNTSILKFECFDFMDRSPYVGYSRINNFHVEIMADDVQCDFIVYFSNATAVIPPKFDGKLNKKNLPLGVTVSYTTPPYYEISFLNKTTVKYSSNKTLPLFIEIESCGAFETELQINDGCSLIFKYQNDTLTLNDRGIELQRMPNWRIFVFAFNEKTLTLCYYRKNSMLHGGAFKYGKTIQTYAELLMEHNDTNEFKSTAFCQTDKKNMKINVKPNSSMDCRTAKFILAGQVELLADDSSVTTKASQTTPKSSESSQSAGFEWWYGLIIGIVALVFIGGIITFCLYRNGIIFKEKMPKNESVLPVVAPIPVAKTPIRDVNEDREEEKEEEEEKDSKKDEKKKPKKSKK